MLLILFVRVTFGCMGIYQSDWTVHACISKRSCQTNAFPSLSCFSSIVSREFGRCVMRPSSDIYMYTWLISPSRMSGVQEVEMRDRGGGQQSIGAVVPLHTQCWRDQTTNNACMAWTGGGMMVGWVLREGMNLCVIGTMFMFSMFFS